MFKEYVGETRFCTGNILGVNVLGNHLPKDNEGYNKCMEITFNSHKEAWKYYCKTYRITIDIDKMTPNGKHDGFMDAKANDCIFEELTEVQVGKLVREYETKFNGNECNG